MSWDQDAARDDVRDYIIEYLGDPDAVLVIDETGGLKKGIPHRWRAAPGHRTAGKVDNAQVAVYLTYASRHGHAVIDRELYVPKRWIADPDRCQAAGVPEQLGFATKPELGRRMLQRALAARYRQRG